MAENKVEKYENPISVTAQFRFCGNPLRADMYRNCSFQCNYCFAKTHISHYDEEKDELNGYGWIEKADIKDIERTFKKAFETNDESKDIVIEFLRHGAPVHVGGMSDPFQPIEFREHLTYRLIQLSNKYNVPLIFSTKQCRLPDEYYEILNPKLHAFQVSLIGYDEEWIRKYEPNTPSPKERINFMETLKSKGFWVAMRVQPLVDLDQALKVMKAVEKTIDYIIIEHLKVAMNSETQLALFNVSARNPEYYVPGHSRYYEKLGYYKKKDIEFLQSQIKGCKIGVGDNDFHHLSQSRCCCGIDTIPGGAFDKYLKYNLTYFVTGDVSEKDLDEMWTPKNNCAGCFNSQSQIKGLTLLKDYVDKYCVDNLDFLERNEKLHRYYSNYLMKSENARKFEKTQAGKDQLNIFDFLGDEEDE